MTVGSASRPASALLNASIMRERLGFDASTSLGDIEVPDFLEGKLHEEDVDESSYQRSGKDGNLKLQAYDGDIVIKLNK